MIIMSDRATPNVDIIFPAINNRVLQQIWNKIKLHLQEEMGYESLDFIKLITNHHSYEELLVMKMNFSVMKTLKMGLECVKSLIDKEHFK